jgi:membrane-bound lytic murein transglycosylase D
MFLLGFFLPLRPALSNPSPNIWDVLRSQFSIHHAIEQAEVQKQITWMMNHPGYLQLLARSEPYLYDILSQIRQKNLPAELALLPMIESAYNPFAYSGKGAAGLWQIMPTTGSGFGLQQDWWFDARRSIRLSTDVALNYLNYLHKYFQGDWLLAIAAYDAGEGPVSRAIQTSGLPKGQISFWRLPLPEETKAYVPKLLALAELITYPEHYHIKLPEIAHVPYFQEVEIGSQIDLNHAAKLAEVPYSELIKLNPAYNRWATAPNQPFKLLIPRDKVATFRYNLAHLPKEKRVSLIKHRVRESDTIDSVARQYLTNPKIITELNQLKSQMLTTNQILLIPSTKNTLAPKPQNNLLYRTDNPPMLQIYKFINILKNK